MLLNGTLLPLVAADHVGEGGGRRGGGDGDVGFRPPRGGQGGPVVEPGQEEALEEASRVQAPAGGCFVTGFGSLIAVGWAFFLSKQG